LLLIVLSGTTEETEDFPKRLWILQARIAEELAPDYLLIDPRTGITEQEGLATSILADREVCITTMSAESVEGTCVAAHALRNAPRLASKAPLRIDFVITSAPPN
jgi:hypothetical protein